MVPLFLSIPEASRQLGISRNHLYHLIRTGRVPFYRLSPRTLRVDLNEMREYMGLLAQGRPTRDDEGEGDE
jgi:excisionase family DNA binding protein